MRLHRSLRWAGGFLCLLVCHAAAPAQTCTKVDGALLLRADAGWKSVAAKTDVPPDKLIVSLFGASFQSVNQAVEMRLVADVGQRGPFPVLEAAARFHAGESGSLNVTLERGIAVFTNVKKSGPALVRIKVRDEAFDVTLSEPKSKFGVEVYGRHVPGPAQVDDPKKDDPVCNVVFFALVGEMVITTEKHATRLQAPPGVASFMWDNVTRMAEVHRYEKLPDSVQPMNADEKKKYDAICKLTEPLAAKPGDIGKLLDEALRSKDPMARKVAVVALGALDETPRLLQALGNADHAGCARHRRPRVAALAGPGAWTDGSALPTAHQGRLHAGAGEIVPAPLLWHRRAETPATGHV